MINKSLALHSSQFFSSASSSASSLLSAKIWTILIAGLIDGLALGTFAWRASMTTCHVSSGGQRRRRGREGEAEEVGKTGIE